jgi:hypothetical protein
MSLPTVFFIHGETSILDANKSYFDFTNQDNYDLYCSETNQDPYYLANKTENIITMQCGHYINKYMLLIHIFPSFPMCCNQCLDDDTQSCSTCETDCIFVCDMCSNFISQPNTIKSIIQNGIDNTISYNYLDMVNHRKRKYDDDESDISQNKKV